MLGATGVRWIPTSPTFQVRTRRLPGGSLAHRHETAPLDDDALVTLGTRIGGPFDSGPDGPGGWWILDEPELHFGPDVLVPDLAGWRRERMPVFPETAWFELPPDWACEVLSPGTRKIDLTAKRRICAEVGVGFLWFVDPLARVLEAFALRDGTWTLIASLKDDDEARVPPFDAISFPLSVLWPD